jgi:hypothetical protein
VSAQCGHANLHETPTVLADLRRFVCDDCLAILWSDRKASHDCASCATCVHDGRRCCGCYDGVCCQSEPWKSGGVA